MRILLFSSDVNKKNFLPLSFFLLLFEGTWYNIFKDKSHKEVTKQYESMFFLLFFLMIEGFRSGSLINGSGLGRQHWSITYGNRTFHRLKLFQFQIYFLPWPKYTIFTSHMASIINLQRILRGLRGGEATLGAGWHNSFITSNERLRRDTIVSSL